MFIQFLKVFRDDFIGKNYIDTFLCVGRIFFAGLRGSNIKNDIKECDDNDDGSNIKIVKVKKIFDTFSLCVFILSRLFGYAAARL